MGLSLFGRQGLGVVEIPLLIGMENYRNRSRDQESKYFKTFELAPNFLFFLPFIGVPILELIVDGLPISPLEDPGERPYSCEGVHIEVHIIHAEVIDPVISVSLDLPISSDARHGPGHNIVVVPVIA